MRRLMLVASLVAAAALARPARPLHAAASTSSRLHWITNGPVWAGATLGDRLFVGGGFTRVAPTSAALGALFAIDVSSGGVLSGLPLVDGEVQAVAADGNGGYYIAGNFGRVGDAVRQAVAHLRGDGTLDPLFAPTVTLSSSPYSGRTRTMSLALTATDVILAGPLDSVNGLSNGAVAALNRVDGTSKAWGSPMFHGYAVVAVMGGQLLAAGETNNVDHDIEAASLDPATGAAIWHTPVGSLYPESTLALALAGTRLIVGGRLWRLDDDNAHSLVALDRATGVLDTAWKPDTAAMRDLTHLPAVEALAVEGSTLYVGGAFAQFGGLARANLAAVEIPTGVVTAWHPASDEHVSALALSPNGIVAGGAFRAIGGVARDKLAEIDAGGNVTAWRSQAYPTTVRAVVGDGGRLVIAGRMGLSGGVARDRMAAFDLSSDTLLPWAPQAPEDLEVTAMAATGNTVVIERTRKASPVERDVVGVPADGSGSAVSWRRPPAPAFYTRLLAATGPFVYVTLEAPGAPVGFVALRRLFALNGEVDQSWSPAAFADTALMAHTTLFLGGSTLSGTAGALRAVDTNTGTMAPWAPVLGYYSPEPPRINVTGLAADGDSLLFVSDGASIFGTGAVDDRSGVAVRSPQNFTSIDGIVPSVGTADGETLLSFGAARRGLGAMAVDQNDAVSWNPGLSSVGERNFYATRPAPVLVTPTDVIVLGQERVTPSVVHGIGVFPRALPRAPHALRWSATGPRVTFSWQPPSPAPSGYVLEASLGADDPPVVTMPLGPATAFTTAARDGTYFVRLRRSDDRAAPPSNQVAVVVGCSAPPPAPLGLTAALASGVVNFTWTPAPFSSPTGYVLDAGTRRGAADIARIPLSPEASSFAAAAPPGTYFVRVRAVNACGSSVATSDAEVTVGAGPLPPAPAAPTVTVGGGQVTLSWPAVAGALAYVLEVGSAPRQADVLTTSVTSAGLSASAVPPGNYYVRVRARSAAGIGPPSDERLVVVGDY